MTANESLTQPTSPITKQVLRALAGGIAGALIGYSMVELLVRLHVPFKSLSWSDLLATVVAVAFFGMGAVMLVLSTSRKRVAESLGDCDASFPATNDEVRNFRLQAVTLGLAGIMLLLPILSLGRLKEIPGGTAAIFAGIVVLFILQTIANIRVWQTSDEFYRGLIMQVGAITFAVGQAALFLWAAAEYLHLVRAISSWQIINLLFAFYLLVSSAFAIRYRR
jgi:hypothetical protein